MSWRQELKLLSRLSNATQIGYFTERHSKIEKLRSKVSSEVQRSGSKQLLSNGQFNEKLFSASSGLLAISTTMETKGSLTPEDSSSISALLAVTTIIVRFGVAMNCGDLDIRLITRGWKSSPASVAAMLAKPQAAIVQTGVLSSTLNSILPSCLFSTSRLVHVPPCHYSGP